MFKGFIETCHHKFTLSELRESIDDSNLLYLKTEGQSFGSPINNFIGKCLDVKCCVACGLKIEYAQIMKAEPRSKRKLYFFGIRNGRAVLFTKDHIVPQSRGGTSRYENIQPLCSDCNQFKGNSLADAPVFWHLRRFIEINYEAEVRMQNIESSNNSHAFKRHTNRLNHNGARMRDLQQTAKMLYNIEC